jgi:hypothetical protein
MKIFRKPRLEFLSKGNTSKYLKYAIGEILLVVIGILIALQINNMNEESKENRVLNEYLVKIKSHTQEDLRELDTIIKARKQFAAICKQARKAIITKTEDQNMITMMTSGLAFVDFYFKPKDDGYEALKNSSSFGKINNSRLDSLLIQYHIIIDLIAENEKSYNEYILTQEAYLSTQFDRTIVLAAAFMPPGSLGELGISDSEINASFKEYTSYPAYRNVVSLAAFQFDAMVAQYEELVKTGEEVIGEIDQLTVE